MGGSPGQENTEKLERFSGVTYGVADTCVPGTITKEQTKDTEDRRFLMILEYNAGRLGLLPRTLNFLFN